MKRKFTFLATLALSLFAATSAMADQTLLTGTGESTATPVVGKKYVIQGNGQSVNERRSWLYDNNGTFAATLSQTLPTGADAMKYVWTFETLTEGTTTTYAAKNDITGRYIFIKGTSNGGAVEMSNEANYFTIEVGTGVFEGYVAFMNASGQYIDMGNSGVGPVTWGDGLDNDYTSRRMTIYEAVIETKTDLQIAMGELNTCYGKYSYFNNEPFPLEKGTEIGQYDYSDDLKNEMLGYLATALNILQEKEEATVEEIEALIQNLEDTNTALLSTRVKLSIADGNYRVVSALTWTQTETVATGEFDEETGEELMETQTTHPTKAMYATLEGKAMWATVDNTDCRYLWNITNLPTNSDSVLVKFMNIATDGILATCTMSAQATLTADSETKTYFQFIERRADGKIVVAIKPSTGGGYAFMHCNGHGRGSGQASNIVGWSADAGASQWILEPVNDDEVQTLVNAYAPIKNHELLVSMFQDAIAEAEAAIADAKDLKFVTERSEGLITSTDQFSSPFTDPTEGSFGNVLSEATDTYWHSTWQGDQVPAHSHYFQVAFTEPIENTIQCYMIRRNVANDHITKLGVFGTNDESVVSKEVSQGQWSNLTEDGWNNLGTFDLSANAVNAGRTYSANGITLPEGGYKYFRFYIDDTVGTGISSTRGYGHFAFFQLYNLTIMGNTRWSQMGQAATDIEKALANAKAVDQETMVIDDYNHLRDTLDAFKALIVDPTALKNAIDANKDLTELVEVGDAPGFWSADSEVGALATILEDATTYLYGGAYTEEQVEAYTEAIQNGASDIFTAANPVEEDQWYLIRFDSEKHYDAHKWNKDGAINNTFGNLFDNVVSPAVVETSTTGEEGNQTTTSELVTPDELSEVKVGHQVHFVDEDVLNEYDVAAFRFVNQGDSAYAIQHKSGLYLGGNERSTCLTLGLVPALFNVRAVGYGKVVIEARKLNGEGYYTESVYLHGANANHNFVTWNNDNVASSSALYIEPIDVDKFDEDEDVAESAILPALPNSMTFKCYPVGFSVSEDSDAKIYAYQGAIREGAQAHYVFNEVEAAAPGQPVLLVVGDPEDFDTEIPEEDYDEIEITLGTSFAVEPLTEGGVHGTYAYEWVDKGTVVVYGNDEKYGKPGNALVLAEGKDATNCTRDISENTGYIVFGENILQDADKDDFDLVITAGWPVKKGDVNCNGEVEISDVVAVLNAMADQSYEWYPFADVNENNEVEISDVVTVLNIMAGVQ